MSIVFVLTNATMSFFLTFLSASREFLYGAIWKVERRRTVEKLRLRVGTNACGVCREIDHDYGFVDHPLDNDFLLKGRLGSSLKFPSCKIIEEEKADDETESELIEMEDKFRAIFEDLFDDSYAEVSYVISPKKWP